VLTLLPSSFAEWHVFDENPTLRDLLGSKWAYPPMLWTEICRKANGYAASACHADGDNKIVVNSKRRPRHQDWTSILTLSLNSIMVSVLDQAA
jgi:predicted phosphoadenosine phosphosulfate sulfurtransferase